MKAAIYARFSTDNQKHETIEVQVECCAEYAKNNNIEIVDIFADEAISGMKSKRPELDRLFLAADAGAFDCILIYDQSRFSRDIVDWFTFRRRMQAADIQIISVTQQLVGGDLNDTAVFATEGINALVNQIHVLQSRQKTVEAMNHMARMGLHTGGSPLLGYDIIDKKYVINEVEAEVVRFIYNMYANGASYKNIIEELNKNGYCTKRGLPFGKNSICEMLRNERYRGVYTYNRIPASKNGKRNSHAENSNMIRIPGAVPQIVPDDTWDRVQVRLSNHKLRARNKADVCYILSGKVRCGTCGGAMVGMKSNGSYYYYACSARQRGKGCTRKPVKKEWLESAVVRHVATALADVKTRKEIALKLLEAQKEIAHSISPAERSINARIQQTKTKIANINNAIAGGIWNSTTSATLTQLENELTRLYKQLSEADRAKVSINNSYEDIISVLNEISATTVFDEESQKVMAHFIERVTVYDDKISIVLNPLKTEVTEITDIDGAGDRNQSINVSSLLLLFDFICNNR